MSEEFKPTPRPWAATHFCKEDGTPIETVEDVIETMGESAIRMKTPVLYGVTEDKADDYLVICYTGNGPKGLVNAQMIAHASNSYETLTNDLAALKVFVSEQAEDEGLWFEAKTAPEAYLQQELRKLHAIIEGTDDFGQLPKPPEGQTP